MPEIAWKNATTLYGLAMVVGAVAGLGAILFEYLAQLVSWGVLQQLVGYAPEGPRGEPALYHTVPEGGLLLVGLLLAPAPAMTRARQATQHS